MEGVRTEKRGGGRRGYAVGIGEAIKVRAAAPEQVRIRNSELCVLACHHQLRYYCGLPSP